MAPERTTKNILIRYAIGTGIIMLGLMAFSAICWWACTSCAEQNPLRRLGFWELLGAAILTSVGFIFLLTIRRRNQADRQNGVSDHSHDPPGSFGTDRHGNWRDLYQQLSSDEREKLKEMMAKICADDNPQTGTLRSTPAWERERQALPPDDHAS
jgi:hypothetical protein